MLSFDCPPSDQGESAPNWNECTCKLTLSEISMCRTRAARTLAIPLRLSPLLSASIVAKDQIETASGGAVRADQWRSKPKI